MSTKAKYALIQAKRDTGLTQWNELLRWAFCLSLNDPDPPKQNYKFDTGIEPIEWKTFAGPLDQIFTALFLIRAKKDQIDLEDAKAVSIYFRQHIERGASSLRSYKSISELLSSDSFSD